MLCVMIVLMSLAPKTDSYIISGGLCVHELFCLVTVCLCTCTCALYNPWMSVHVCIRIV